MKIQFVYAPFLDDSASGYQHKLWPPTGLMYLASYLRKYYQKNLKMKITDGVLLGKEMALQEIIDFGPDLVAISSLTPNSQGSYFLANKIKEIMPQTFIIFGGVHASSLPEEVYQKSKTDLVVIGEGEQTFLEIVKNIFRGKKSFEKIPGLAISKNGKIFTTPPRQFIQNLDTLPFPAHDLIEHKERYLGWFFRKQNPEAVIMSTRGCPFHCFFCTDVIWKSSRPYLRMRSPKNIADELEWLVKEYGIKEYYDLADEINCSELWAIEVCEEIINRKLKLTWKCQLRADKVSEKLVKALADSGCWYVNLGVESGNQKTLDGIGKKITLSQVQRACKLLKKYGLKVNLLLMLFNVWEKNGRFGWEGVKESNNTLKLASLYFQKGWADLIQACPTVPYPGSPLYRLSLKKNLIPQKLLGSWEDWHEIWNVPLKLPGVSPYDYTKLRLKTILLLARYGLGKTKSQIHIRNATDIFSRSFGIFLIFLELLKRGIQHQVFLPRFNRGSPS